MRKAKGGKKLEKLARSEGTYVILDQRAFQDKIIRQSLRNLDFDTAISSTSFLLFFILQKYVSRFFYRTIKG